MGRAEYAPPPPSSRPSDASGWEILRPDYRNVRGLNYVPVYPELWRNPPELPPNLQFLGSASPAATWRFYRSSDVDTQLGYLRGLGCNAVRVFLSHAVWEHDEAARRPGGDNRFLADFADLVRLCEKHRLYLMPVFWTEFSPFGLDPSAVPYDDIERWVRSPGNANTNFAWAREHRADAFVEQVVRVGTDSRAVFAWDVMNEPNPISHGDWLAHFARLIRRADPNPAHAVTAGFAALPDFVDIPLLREPAFDLLCYHPYGVFRQNVAEWTRMARASARPPRSDREKPVLASEGGAPNLTMRYQDFFGQIRGEGVGFLSWMAVIDDPRSWLPFQSGTGIVYWDGEVRDEGAAEAMQAAARADGVPPWQLPPIRVKTDFTGFLRQYPFEPGYGIDDVLFELQPVRWERRPKLSDANAGTVGYTRQREQLGNVSTWGLGILLDQPGTERRLIPPEQEAVVLSFAREFQLRDLFSGPFPWVVDDPFGADWPRYDAFFTAWGKALWQIVTQHVFRA
jgi:hypothetical protein